MRFVIDLAEELKLDRSGLLRKLKKLGMKVIKLPRMTTTGPQLCSAVEDEDAAKLLDYYETAKRNAGQQHG
jgi:hypothetical protein